MLFCRTRTSVARTGFANVTSSQSMPLFFASRTPRIRVVTGHCRIRRAGRLRRGVLGFAVLRTGRGGRRPLAIRIRKDGGLVQLGGGYDSTTRRHASNFGHCRGRRQRSDRRRRDGKRHRRRHWRRFSCGNSGRGASGPLRSALLRYWQCGQNRLGRNGPLRRLRYRLRLENALLQFEQISRRKIEVCAGREVQRTLRP